MCFLFDFMKIFEIKKVIYSILDKFDIEHIDGDYIICEVLDCKLGELRFIQDVSKKQFKSMLHATKKRAKGIPVQKIFNKAYFYGLSFFVDKKVLCPRADSEILVETAIKIVKPKQKVLDLCTGSGALAIALKTNTKVDVYASDIDRHALKIAKKNSILNDVDIKLIKSDLFSNIDTTFDLIVSNPPYIKTADIIQLDKKVRCYDPIIALDGGKDGLFYYKKIIPLARKHLVTTGKLILEIGYDQAELVTKILEENKYKNIKVIKDYGGNDRVIYSEV